MLNFDDEVTPAAISAGVRAGAIGFGTAIKADSNGHTYTIASTSTGRIRVEDKRITTAVRM
jgi:hypothetical protein